MAVTRKRKASGGISVPNASAESMHAVKPEAAVVKGGRSRTFLVKKEVDHAVKAEAANAKGDGLRAFMVKEEVYSTVKQDKTSADTALSEKAAQKLGGWEAKPEQPIKSETTPQQLSAPQKEDVKQPLGPFPDMERPYSEECRAACDALAALHGMPEVDEVEKSQESKVPRSASGTGADGSSPTKSQCTVLDSLVRTILSQNTTDLTSKRAFDQLKAAFPTWKSVLDAQPGSVEEAVRCGGLADIKVQRIRSILETVLLETGDTSLEYVRHLDDAEIKQELSRFKGVGPKTVACVLMFCLQRKEFPVDTHVWRITKSLGWVPAKASREATYEHLNLRVPDDIKYALHVLLVRHGKRCVRCAKGGKPRFPSDGPCPLIHVMRKGNHPDVLK